VAVNWCPALGTVLANEEVIDGLSERGSHPVVRMPMRQWMLAITKYADALLEGLEGVDWADSIKEMQRNWIGRSEGAAARFCLEGGAGSALEAGAELEVYTTRPDTLAGATYVVVAPEHPLLAALASDAQRAAVVAYAEAAARKSDLERTELAKDKSGVDTGARAVNPATGEAVPVYVADYVLGSYGTGAIMAVPAHDARDLEFARAHGLPVRRVVAPAGDAGGAGEEPELPYTEAGFAVGSSVEATGFALDGLPTADAKTAATAWLEAAGAGGARVNYRLRDWLFARQRYWGEPFPVVYAEAEGPDAPPRGIAPSELPLELPPMADFSPTGTPEPPLAKAADWVAARDPRDGAPARRETSTMPQWAGSCWYYLRFIDPGNEERLVSEEAERYWMPVDL
jgi:leucyl-tRNA synthetase